MRGKWSSIVAVLVLAAAAAAQTTALTYQGRLKNGGQPASGLHDFRLRLFDAAQGGSQLGSTQCLNNVAVADGLFTASIDFGQQFASPDQRFLEIQVREDTGLGCGNGAGFVTLAPRQPLTAAPLASHANSAFALDAADGGPANAVFVNDAGNVGIGTTDPETPLHVNGVFQWGGDSTNFGYSGQDAVGLYLEQFGSSPARSPIRIQTSKSGDLVNYSQLFIDPFNGFSFSTIGSANGDVGIGTTEPLATLDVRGDIRFGPGGHGVKAAGGLEDLCLLRGNIDGNGSKLAGEGFTSERLGEGEYRIKFIVPFSAVPSVTATAHNPFVGDQRSAEISILAADLCIIHTSFPGDDNRTDSDFSFCVMGPR